jgi:hypothetical protein
MLCNKIIQEFLFELLNSISNVVLQKLQKLQIRLNEIKIRIKIKIKKEK